MAIKHPEYANEGIAERTKERMAEYRAEAIEVYLHLLHNDATVARVGWLIDKCRMTETDALKVIVTVLVEQRDNAIKQLTQAEALRPRRYRDQHGNEFRYDPPDDLIPVQHPFPYVQK